jgi:esterase FrsA
MAQLDEIPLDEDSSIYHIGPSQDAGPLPALFYFALTGSESLTLAPYNQLVEYLADFPIRIFSLTLPEHLEGDLHNHSIDKWAYQLKSGADIISPFIAKCQKALHFLIGEGWIDRSKIAAGGLSRGAFIASHLAAKEKLITHILGFSPLTSLDGLEEFHGNPPPIAQNLSLTHKILELSEKSIFFLIGNRDIRVGTEKAFSLLFDLTNQSYRLGHRSPPMQLHLFPAIGNKGHGTPKEIFHEGALWLLKQFGVGRP